MKLDTLFENVYKIYNDLQPIHFGMLKKIASDTLDFDNLTDRQLEVLNQLQDFNLIDSAYALTPDGAKATHLSTNVAVSYDTNLARQKQHAMLQNAREKKKVNLPDVDLDDEESDNDELEDFDDENSPKLAQKKKRKLGIDSSSSDWSGGDKLQYKMNDDGEVDY